MTTVVVLYLHRSLLPILCERWNGIVEVYICDWESHSDILSITNPLCVSWDMIEEVCCPRGKDFPIPEGMLEKVSYDQGHPFLFVSVGILIPCLLSVCSTHCLYLSSPLGLVVLTFWSVKFRSCYCFSLFVFVVPWFFVGFCGVKWWYVYHYTMLMVLERLVNDSDQRVDQFISPPSLLPQTDRLSLLKLLGGHHPDVLALWWVLFCTISKFEDGTELRVLFLWFRVVFDARFWETVPWRYWGHMDYLLVMYHYVTCIDRGIDVTFFITAWSNLFVWMVMLKIEMLTRVSDHDRLVVDRS